MIFAVLPLAAMAWAVPQATAKVLLSERELLSPLGEDVSAWLQLELVDDCPSLGMAALSSLGEKRARDREERLEREARARQQLLRGFGMRRGSGMSQPNPSLCSAAAGPGSYALPGEITVPPRAALEADLPPEAKPILPTGPPYRWFRPPEA